MHKSIEGGSPNPHDLTLHQQIKQVSSRLKPELVRLHEQEADSSGQVHVYRSLLEEIRSIKKEVANHDALFAFHNIIHHMEKAIELAEKQAKNKEILAHLQEVMALLFKAQNCPS